MFGHLFALRFRPFLCKQPPIYSKRTPTFFLRGLPFFFHHPPLFNRLPMRVAGFSGFSQAFLHRSPPPHPIDVGPLLVHLPFLLLLPPTDTFFFLVSPLVYPHLFFLRMSHVSFECPPPPTFFPGPVWHRFLPRSRPFHCCLCRPFPPTLLFLRSFLSDPLFQQLTSPDLAVLLPPPSILPFFFFEPRFGDRLLHDPLHGLCNT